MAEPRFYHCLCTTPEFIPPGPPRSFAPARGSSYHFFRDFQFRTLGTGLLSTLLKQMAGLISLGPLGRDMRFHDH